MKFFHLISALCAFVFITASLGACTSAQETAAQGTVTTAATSLASVCKAAAPLLTQATAQKPDPTTAAGELLAFATSVCTIDGQVVTTLDPTGSSVTPSWLVGVLQALQTAASLAPVILPLV